MKYFIWVLGCAMNYSDAERLVSELESLGYIRAKNETEADVIFMLACSVRQSAIDRIFGKAKVWRNLRVRNEKLKIFLTGCVLSKDKPKMEKIFDGIFTIDEIRELPQLLNDKYQMTNLKSISKLKLSKSDLSENLKPVVSKVEPLKIENSESYFNIIPHYENNFRAFVPIMTGCNNFCSYCAVPYTRGREKSRPMEEIVAEVKSLVKKGYKEITLLGQNVNSYQATTTSNILQAARMDFSKKGSTLLEEKRVQIRTKGFNPFWELIKEIDKIPGNYRVYFYSNHPKDMSDELIEALPKLKHFPAYIHLPLQSGNDEIIKKMNRHYTKKQYMILVEKIRKTMPEVTLTTDIIVGFPGETKKAFGDTVEVMKKAKFDMAFLAQYSSRPGTAAAVLEDNVSRSEKKRREDVLQKVLKKTAAENNQKLVGTKQRILFGEIKKEKLYGRTEGYKVVEIDLRGLPRTELRGQFGMVTIKSATAWKLVGKLV